VCDSLNACSQIRWDLKVAVGWMPGLAWEGLMSLDELEPTLAGWIPRNAPVLSKGCNSPARPHLDRRLLITPFYNTRQAPRFSGFAGWALQCMRTP